ncbi:endoplasmic reticulum lectin 1 isoform X1 [Schistocerca cancellata]|uniref:endoplasmic reticulum lectin 1 isoform X1 n=1 Tax=Schistocerca cancellata TaxID=274614 RepID=UPI002118E013|nr:endoplasmic reticulum lectin 1 isoform X1 [Schistocerca cancellata]
MTSWHLLICLLYLLVSDYGCAESGGFDDSIFYRINWPGNDETDLLEIGDAEPLFVTSANNERYKCLLPSSQEEEKDSVETYDGQNPLELLSAVFPPSAPCSHRLESYWTYELCHGRYIRQFHEEREGKRVKHQEFYLGRWNMAQYHKLFDELEKQAKEKQPIPTKRIEGVNMPYLEINMTDGTICDLNQKPRMTRVLYVCFAHPKHEITSLKEISTCEYEVIVLSPLLCKHPGYRPQRSGENIINCLPVEGSPIKPKDLMMHEAESIKFRHQKVIDEKLQQLYAVFSFDREGQDGETRVRVEIHPMDMSIDELEAPASPQPPEPQVSRDTSPVMNFLAGKDCLTGGTGWWKYEFCYGASVKQFHEEKDGTKTVVNLGYFNKEAHVNWLYRNPHKRPKPLGQRKHISHLYTGGTICDKTGRARQTEVKLKCLENSASPGAVALYLLEPKTCEYVLGVESPLICSILSEVDENGLVELPLDYTGDGVTVSAEDDDELPEPGGPKGDE